MLSESFGFGPAKLMRLGTEWVDYQSPRHDFFGTTIPTFTVFVPIQSDRVPFTLRLIHRNGRLLTLSMIQWQRSRFGCESESRNPTTSAEYAECTRNSRPKTDPTRLSPAVSLWSSATKDTRRVDERQEHPSRRSGTVGQPSKGMWTS